MANMSYCRFHNTAEDIMDCARNWDPYNLSIDELRGMKVVLRGVREILNNIGAEVDDAAFDEEIEHIDGLIKEAQEAA